LNILFSKKNVITLVIYLIVVGLIIYIGLVPLAKKTADLYKSYKDKAAQLDASQKEIVNLNTLQNMINSNPSTISNIVNYIPRTDNTEFVNQVESLAIKGGNTFQSFKYLTNAKAIINVSGTTEKEYELVIKGNYPSITNFLNGLTKINQINNVYNISILTDQNGTTATIDGAVYLRK
jgi:Tfp pilus assembly protein PilO